MLKKKYRLSKFKKLEGVRNITFPFFILKVSKSEEEVSRFAFVASKKFDKRAVGRNKAKRSMGKAMEAIVGQTVGGYNFIFILKRAVFEKSQAELSSYIKEIFKVNNFLK